MGRLYTRGGDRGYTQLPGGDGVPAQRVRKDSPELSALGGLDELNALLGLALAEAQRINHMRIGDSLRNVQEELLRVGAVLAAVESGAPPTLELEAQTIRKMEREIDEVCADLPALKHFILPGGFELAARLHVARAVCRRTERAAVATLGPPPATPETPADEAGAATPPHRPSHPPEPKAAGEMILTYLNRLSDLLFALARLANRDAGMNDKVWIP